MVKPKAKANGDDHHHDRYEKIKEKLHHLHLEDAKIHLIHQKYVIFVAPIGTTLTSCSRRHKIGKFANLVCPLPSIHLPSKPPLT